MSELPDNLADLERHLAARPFAEPNAALRQRVLTSVRGELASETKSRWRYAATLAAAVLLGANLSLSAALNGSWPHDSFNADDLDATAARLRQLDSEMSEQEARRQALLLQARSQLTFMPSPEQIVRERQVLPYMPR